MHASLTELSTSMCMKGRFMPKMFAYDYYRVAVPGDMCEGDEAMEELASVAINEARSRARLYCIPALWAAKLVSGEVGGSEVVFQVVRKRRVTLQ